MRLGIIVGTLMQYDQARVLVPWGIYSIGVFMSDVFADISVCWRKFLFINFKEG